MASADDKKAIEKAVNSAAITIKALGRMALETRSAITADSAAKISNYLRILVDDVAQELERIAAHNVPPPGEFSLDADIPASRPPIPSKPVYRAPEPEGRLVGQRKTTPAALEDDGVGFIQE